MDGYTERLRAAYARKLGERGLDVDKYLAIYGEVADRPEAGRPSADPVKTRVSLIERVLTERDSEVLDVIECLLGAVLEVQDPAA